MTHEQAFELVKRILVDEMDFDAADVTLDAKLQDDIGCDHGDIGELYILLEYYGALPDEEEPNDPMPVTVRDVVEYVVKHKGESA
jgi:acyl carrier protein